MERPDIILITSMMTYWYPGTANTVRLLRESFGGVKIVLGGIYATLFKEHARKYIKPDIVIPGYGEKKALRILDEIFGISRGYSCVPEFDDRGVLPWELYKRIDYAVLLTSRGCPYRCSYCATNRLNPFFVRRPVEDVIQEILLVKEKFDVGDFVFYDDALFFDRKNYIVPMLSELIRRDVKVRFHTPNGLFVREIDEVLSELMFESGFRTVRLSVESVSPELLFRSSYKINRKVVVQAVNCLVKAGYKHSGLEAYLLVGLPGQRYEDVEENLKFIADVGVVSRIAYYSPIPGTKDWEELKRRGVINDFTDPLLTNNTVYPYINNDLTQEEIVKLKMLASELNSKIKAMDEEAHGSD